MSPANGGFGPCQVRSYILHLAKPNSVINCDSSLSNQLALFLQNKGKTTSVTRFDTKRVISTKLVHLTTSLSIIKIKGSFTRQKNQVRTRQERSTDLTFLPLQTKCIMFFEIGTDNLLPFWFDTKDVYEFGREDCWHALKAKKLLFRTILPDLDIENQLTSK